jgi:GNAT superfamily N-acetyltransferase
MIRSDLFTVPGYLIKFLDKGDSKQLQYFLERSADYFVLVTGLPINPINTQSILEDVPEGKSIEDKVLVGIYSSQDNLIGVLDAIRDHPARGDWWLGLLLIDPLIRGKGLGNVIYAAFEKWVAGLDAKDVYLGVVETNHRAFLFWQRIGFEIGNLDQEVIVMRRLIKGE